MPPSTSLLSSFTRLSLHPSTRNPTFFNLQQTRNASHASQGVANGAKQGPGKRLGAKKGNTELVVPGNIIFRQRGSHWFPGENVVMGRDHTISSLVKGYVRYYRDPSRPDKKFIGVVLNQEEMLPRKHGVPRRRRLGMEERAMERTPAVEVLPTDAEGIEAKVKEAVRLGVGRRLKMLPAPDTAIRQGYQVRESNWSIGRTVEMEGIGARPYKSNDRWLAWRKRREGKKIREATRVTSRGTRTPKQRGPPGGSKGGQQRGRPQTN